MKRTQIASRAYAFLREGKADPSGIYTDPRKALWDSQGENESEKEEETWWNDMTKTANERKAEVAHRQKKNQTVPAAPAAPHSLSGPKRYQKRPPTPANTKYTNGNRFDGTD